MRETIANMMSGGRISKMESMVADLGRQNESLSLQLEELSTMKEGAADFDWTKRLDIDEGWYTVTGAASGATKYITKQKVDMYADLAAYMDMFNPLIHRAITIKTLFTFSRSFQIFGSTDAIQELVDVTMDDLLNRQSVFSQQAIQEADADLQKSGNLFVAIWTNTKVPQVRFWSSDEMTSIVLDEDDSNRPIYYVRSWINSRGIEKTLAYPSVFNDDLEDTIEIGGTIYDVDNSVSVYHMSTRKGIRQKWAVSELSSVLRWAKAHEGFLEDFAAIVKALRKYTHMFNSKGSSAQVGALAGQFAGNQAQMHNPLQSNPTGSMVFATEGNDMKVVDAGAGKIVGAKDSRYFLIMVCAGSGVPETLLTGDPSTGNLATAKELTGPFLTLIESRQTDWSDTLEVIFRKITDSDTIKVSFPPIRSQDSLDYVNSLIEAATLGSPGNFKGTISADSLITSLYEALDIDVDDNDKDKLVASFLDAASGQSAEDTELAGAIERMVAYVREMQRG
jgi:hypothetical protein